MSPAAADHRLDRGRPRRGRAARERRRGAGAGGRQAGRRAHPPGPAGVPVALTRVSPSRDSPVPASSPVRNSVGRPEPSRESVRCPRVRTRSSSEADDARDQRSRAGSPPGEPALLGSRCTTCATVVFPPRPPRRGFCRNPACDGEDVRDRRAVPARAGCGPTPTRSTSRRRRTSRRTDPFEPFALAAVELPEGMVVLGQVADGYGVADLRGRRRGRAGGGDALRRRDRGRADLALEAGRSSWARRPTSEQQRRRRPRRRHAPVGQVGPPVHRVRRARGPRRARRRRHRVERRRPRRRRRDRAQRLRRLRRRRDVRPGAGLERRPGRHVVRRLRDRRPGARHRAGPDPGRAVRGRAGRRRRHHAEGLPRAERRGAVGRPRLAAVPAARHDQPGVLRALRPPPDGPLRRHQRGLRAGEGQERPARAGEPERPLPQGGRGRRTCSASAVVSDPLHLLDICATSDGAAAVVLASADYARAARPRPARCGSRRSRR